MAHMTLDPCMLLSAHVQQLCAHSQCRHAGVVRRTFKASVKGHKLVGMGII